MISIYKCCVCKYRKEVAQFGLKKNNNIYKTCKICRDKINNKYNDKKNNKIILKNTNANLKCDNIDKIKLFYNNLSIQINDITYLIKQHLTENILKNILKKQNNNTVLILQNTKFTKNIFTEYDIPEVDILLFYIYNSENEYNYVYMNYDDLNKYKLNNILNEQFNECNICYEKKNPNYCCNSCAVVCCKKCVGLYIINNIVNSIFMNGTILSHDTDNEGIIKIKTIICPFCKNEFWKNYDVKRNKHYNEFEFLIMMFMDII
jgi:hypothetical protein